MSDVTEVPLAPEVFWGCVAALVLGLFSWALYKALPRSEAGTPPFRDIQGKLGLSAVPAAAFWIGALLWLGLLLILVAGLYAAIWDMLWQSKEFLEAEKGNDKFRFLVTRLAGTTAVLGVVVAFPVTLNRLKLTREQNETAKEALFNQKITEAAADLHAQRQVTLPETYKKSEADAPRKRFNGWEDDVVRRNAAIDRLEGLVRERPEREIAERVARILSMYVRELSRETWPAKTPPETDVPEKLHQWANGLPPLRSDMEAAVVSLSRLAAIVGLPARDLPFDLRESNLQRARLTERDLQGANLSGANVQGADLSGAKMQGAELSGANMLGADFSEAKMQGAELSGAEMQWADLSKAEMQGANLSWAKMQGAKLNLAAMQRADLSGAEMQGASLMAAKLQGAKLSWAEMQGAELRWVEMQGADLTDAKMLGADLTEAKMQGADLTEAKMLGADLTEAKMQGAELSGAEFSEETDLTDAALRGASVTTVDDITISQLLPFRYDIFADSTVQLPEGVSRPDHWHPSSPDDPEELDYDDFNTRWRAWQRSIGQDPDDPK